VQQSGCHQGNVASLVPQRYASDITQTIIICGQTEDGKRGKRASMPPETDHYVVLGIAHDASSDEIRAAYRRAARACHPDLHPGDATAAARFVVVQRAYEVLVDPERRAAYRRPAPTTSRAPARPVERDAGPVLPRDLQETLIAVRVIARMARPRVERRFRQLIRYLEGL